MRNVNYAVEEADYAVIAATSPADSWVDVIPVADQIEQRLWQKYERDFTSQHEESLAWRYQPTGEEETALVLKYFPDVPFTLKDGSQMIITWQGIVQPHSAGLLEWDNVKILTCCVSSAETVCMCSMFSPMHRAKSAAKSACRSEKRD